MAKADSGSAKVWKENRSQAENAFKEKNYPAAETYFKAALAEATKFGAKDDRLAESLDDLGTFYLRTDNYEAAEPLYKQAAEIRHGDPNAGMEAGALIRFGMVSEQLRHYDSALESYSRAGDLVSQKIGRDHPSAVDCVFFKGRVEYEKGDFAQAEPSLKRAFDLFQHPASRIHVRKGDPAVYGVQVSRGTFKPDYAKALEAARYLNDIYIHQSKLPEAGAILKETLKLIDDNSGKGDPALLESLNDMSAFYISMTNFSAAEPVLTRLIKLQLKQLNATNGTALDTQAILANVYVQEKKNDAAETLYQESLVLADKNFGPESRQSSVALANLAKFEIDQNRYEKAEPLYRRELVQTEKVQPDGIALMPILSGQAVVYAKLNRDAELLAVYQREIKIYEKMFGATNAALVNPLTESAKLLRKQKRDAEADALEARIKTIQDGQNK